MSDVGIVVERARSQRFVQVAFAMLSLICLACALLVHLGAPALGLPHEATSVVAFAFLAAGVLDALVMLAWERLFPV